MKKVNKLVLDNAKNLAIRLSSAEIRKRVFVLSAAAMSVSDLLDDGELKLKHKNSLFKITSLDDVLEIADLYSDDIRVDVRVIFDENTFYIPKSHEKFYATPEIYLVVRMTEDVENIEPVGFIESSELPEAKSNTEYLAYDINILKPVSELKNAINKIEKTQQIFSKEAHAKIEELAIAFLDGEISDSEKVFFIQHVMKCPFCREKLSEMNEFDNVVRQLNKYPDLLNDQTLDILTGALARAYSLPDAQPVFLPDDEEEQDLILGTPVETQENTEISENIDDSLDNTNTTIETDLTENDNEKPFLLEYPEEDTEEKTSQETLLELGSLDALNAGEIAGMEISESIDSTVDITPDITINQDTEISAENEIIKTEDTPALEISEINLEDNTENILEQNIDTVNTGNDNEDFLLDFADDEDNDIDKTQLTIQEDSGATAESFQQENDNITGDAVTAEDLDFIDAGKNTENTDESSSFELQELTSDEQIKEPELLEESDDDITLDMIDDNSDVIEETIDTQPLSLEETPQEILQEEPANEHLLLLGDEPELLIDEETPDIELANSESQELTVSSESVLPKEKTEDIIPLKEESNILDESDRVESTQAEIIEETETETEKREVPEISTIEKTELNEEKEELSEEMQAMFDEDLRSLLEASDDDDIIIGDTEDTDFVTSSEAQPDEEKEQEQQQQEVSEVQSIDPELQSLMDDDLMAMLMEDNVPTVSEEEASVPVPKQIAQKLSQQPTENNDIEMLYDETTNPSGNKESQITVEEPPVVKSAVNKTKKLAVGLFIFLILLAGGTTTYFMKFGKSLPGMPEGDENSTDGGALFDFGNKSPDAEEEPAVPQDINKSMTNVFSEQPSALTITKISWNVNDKLAQNDAFKNYLQVAGKNLQMNLQNDLANTTEFAYNNKIHLNFQVTKNNEIKNLQVLDSSGSEQIDNVVLRSIKETLKYINAPNIKEVKGDYNLSLIINF